LEYIKERKKQIKISDLEKLIAAFRQEHGDMDLDIEYYCDSCNDIHESPGYSIEKTYDGKKAVIDIRRIGE